MLEHTGEHFYQQVADSIGELGTPPLAVPRASWDACSQSAMRAACGKGGRRYQKHLLQRK